MLSISNKQTVEYIVYSIAYTEYKNGEARYRRRNAEDRRFSH